MRKYGFYYRYDTDAERRVLNRFCAFVNDRFNYLTPTKKPVGFASDANGRRKRLYDKPKTPPGRLLEARVLATDKTEQLYLASILSALPDVRKGIRIKAS